MLNTTLFLMGSEMQNGEEEEVLDQEKEEKASRLHHFLQWLTSNIYILALLIYGSWTALGILFYMYYDNFTAATAFYYAMDAGLSIGFCYPADPNDWSKLFTTFYVLLGSSVISGACGVFAASALPRRGQVFKGVEPQRGWWRTLLQWYREHRAVIIMNAVWIFWLTWGSVYAYLYEKMTPTASVYWAMTTLATGGQQTPPCLGNTEETICDMGSFRGAIMGIYMLFGVPIYAAAMAQMARYTIGWLLRQRQEMLLNRPIEDAEFLLAANVLSPEGSETLVLGEYILLELMRLGRTNLRQIEEIKRRFHQLDKQKLGELELSQLQRDGLVVSKGGNDVDLEPILQSIEAFSQKHAGYVYPAPFQEIRSGMDSRRARKDSRDENSDEDLEMASVDSIARYSSYSAASMDMSQPESLLDNEKSQSS